MTTKRIHFTDAVIKSLPIPNDCERVFYRDMKENALLLQITKKGNKNFYFAKSYKGQTRRYKIGSATVLTTTQARAKLNEFKVNLLHGVIPNKEPKKSLKGGVTLNEVFNRFMEERQDLRIKTITEYKRMWQNKIAPKYGDKTLDEITPTEMKEFHRTLPGKYSANRVIVLIKTIYNYAIKENIYTGTNPAKAVRRNKEENRIRSLSKDELTRLQENINTVQNKTTRDAILVLLFTGARKGNVFSMAWNDIDFNSKTWCIPQTKTIKNARLPLSEVVIEILADRKKLNHNNSPWVFWSAKSKSGHIYTIQKGLKALLKVANIKSFRVHDFRHNYASALVGVGTNPMIIKDLLIHHSLLTTEKYVEVDVEHSRPATNTVCNNMVTR